MVAFPAVVAVVLRPARAHCCLKCLSGGPAAPTAPSSVTPRTPRHRHRRRHRHRHHRANPWCSRCRARECVRARPRARVQPGVGVAQGGCHLRRVVVCPPTYPRCQLAVAGACRQQVKGRLGATQHPPGLSVTARASLLPRAARQRAHRHPTDTGGSDTTCCCEPGPGLCAHHAPTTTGRAPQGTERVPGGHAAGHTWPRASGQARGGVIAKSNQTKR